MKADAGNLESKKNYFSGRSQKGRDYDTGLTVGEWVIHGSCYNRLEKKFIFTKTNEIDEMWAMR